MSQLLASLPLVGRWFGPAGHTTPTVQLAPVPVHAVETAAEKRPRTLKHLIRANHANHALLYGPRTGYHNHMVHALSSAYLLGAGVDQLHDIYSAETKQLEPWTPSPAEVVEADWRDFLGQVQYQRAYVDFFEDVLAQRSVGYDWPKVVDLYLLQEPEPLVNSLIGGLGHPMIHLAYAYEMDSRVIAMEGLAMAAVSRNYLHRYLDDPSYTRPPPPSLGGGPGGRSLSSLLAHVAVDKRFDEHDAALAGAESSGDNDDNDDDLVDKSMEALFATPGTEAALLEYWNAWAVADDPTRQFQDVQEVAADLLVATVAPGTHAYNFFLCHVLTTSHAARVLLPHLPARFHVPLLRQWWLLTLAVYVSVCRPSVDRDYVPTDHKGRGWTYVEEQAVASRWRTDAHYVKAIRALKDAARTWGDIHDRYLNAAVRFVDDFEGWTF